MADKDLLKVIAGLECCLGDDEDCGLCPHKGEKMILCIDALMQDALEILREVEQDGLR